VQLKLKPDQIDEALAECDDVYIWIDDLFGEMGAYIRVDKGHFMGTLKAESKKGWNIAHDVFLRGDDLWIGGGG